MFFNFATLFEDRNMAKRSGGRDVRGDRKRGYADVPPFEIGRVEVEKDIPMSGLSRITPKMEVSPFSSPNDVFYRI